MMMDQDQHRANREYYQLGEINGDVVYVGPALAHRRAGDSGFLALVPNCPLCEASKEAWAESLKAILEFKESLSESKRDVLTDGA